MPTRFLALFRKLGKLDKIFLIVLTVSFIGNFISSASLWELFLTFAAFVLSILVALKWLVFGIRKLIWRLRYRLLVVYLFIAVVPIVLITLLGGIGTWVSPGRWPRT